MKEDGKFKRNCIGFTFLELVFVMVIILVLVAVSTPRFIRSYQYLEFNNFNDDVLDLSRTLQQLSVLKGKTIKMAFNEENNRIEVFMKEVKDGDIIWVAFSDPVFRPYAVPEKYNFKSSPENIYFYPDNRITDAIVNISDNYGHESEIIFDNEKGEIVKDNE